MVFSEKQSNKETPVVNFQQFLSWKKMQGHHLELNNTFDHDTLMGVKDMKIPRVWSLHSRRLPTCGKKRVKWRWEMMGFNSGGMNLFLFWTESFSENLFELSLILGDYPQNIFPQHDWYAWKTDRQKSCTLVYYYTL